MKASGTVSGGRGAFGPRPCLAAGPSPAPGVGSAAARARGARERSPRGRAAPHGGERPIWRRRSGTTREGGPPSAGPAGGATGLPQLGFSSGAEGSAVRLLAAGAAGFCPPPGGPPLAEVPAPRPGCPLRDSRLYLSSPCSCGSTRWSGAVCPRRNAGLLRYTGCGSSLRTTLSPSPGSGTSSLS